METNHLTEVGDSDKRGRRSVFHEYLGDRVKYFRELRGLTQEGTAIAVGYTKNMWTQIETGRSGIVLEKLPKVCEVLQVEEAVLTWPGEIPLDLIDLVNMLLELGRRKGETTHFDSIESLIRTAHTKLPK